MAKISSTAATAGGSGSGEVQNAPSATAPAGRATRATRSVSREPVEQASPRRTRGGKGKGGKATREVEDDQQLATVDEDDQAIDPELTAGDDAEALRRASVGAHSVLSGTTAKTSFSQTEIEELDKDLMLETLPRLNSDADALLQMLLPNGAAKQSVAWKEIAHEDSKDNKLFSRRLTNLGVDKADFGSKAYIDQDIVLSVLLETANVDDIPNGPWRPDPILVKANIAKALSTLVLAGTDPSDNKSYEGLHMLEASFAAAMGITKFSQEAFLTYLDIATQLAIARLIIFRERADFDPRTVIATTFWGESDDGEEAFPHAEAFGMQTLHAPLHQAFINRLRQRTHDLSAPFADGNPADAEFETAINALRAKFPWSNFLATFRKYAVDRRGQLEGQINTSGGADGLVANLRAQVDHGEEVRMAATRRESFKAGTPKKAFGKSAIAQIKARQAELAAQPNIAPVAQMGQNQDGYPQTAPPVDNYLEGTNWVPTMDDDEGAVNRTAAATAQSTLAHLSGRPQSNLDIMSDFQRAQVRNAGQKPAARKGKGRAFNEAQPNAQRVEWNSQYGYNPENELMAQLGKHARDETDDQQDAFDPTQDEGFQTDERDPEGANLRRALTAGGAPGRAPMASMGPPSSSMQPSPTKRQRANPGSSIPQPLAPFNADRDDTDAPPGSYYERAKIAAKTNRAMAQSQKPPQVRRPWSEFEENALIELIEALDGEGISWSSLKSTDANMPEGQQRLPIRSSEDMRFKARNMKLTMLLGDSPLPRNWEFVILDKKARDKLAARGIQYHQEPVRHAA